MASPDGEGEIEVDGTTVGEALDAVFDQHDDLRERITEDGGLRRFVNVYVSGEDIRFQDGLDTELTDGDEVTILPGRRRRLAGCRPATRGESHTLRAVDGIDPVAILCGGAGTRLQEHTHAIPKALVEIGGKPILWHVVRIYAAQGFRRFLLLTGYLGEMIEEFGDRRRRGRSRSRSSASTRASTPRPAAGSRARATSSPAGPSALTYADGVADIDLEALVSVPPRPRATRHGDGRQAVQPVGRRRARRRRPGRRLRGEAAPRPVGQRRVLLLRARFLAYIDEDSVLGARPLARPRGGRASCTRSDTRASGTAWTPTRTPSCSTTCGAAAGRPGPCGSGTPRRSGAR